MVAQVAGQVAGLGVRPVEDMLHRPGLLCRGLQLYIITSTNGLSSNKLVEVGLVVWVAVWVQQWLLEPHLVLGLLWAERQHTA